MRKTIRSDWFGLVPMLLRMLLCLIVAFVASVPVTTEAQTAREYLNTPVEQWSGFIEVGFSRAQSAASADLPLPNNLTVSRVTVPYLLYSFPFRKKYAGVSVTTPFVRVRALDGSESTGFSDPGFGFHMNLFGLPALKKEEIGKAVPQNLMSIHFNVNPPIGSYDRNRAANMGANRWAFNPVVNLNVTRDKGTSWFEAYAAGRFYSDNEHFRGDGRLSQKPLLILTGHYSHNIGKKTWASIGTNYDYGGETSLDNVPQRNIANGFRPIVAISRLFGSVRLNVRYENTATRAVDHSRNGSVTIRVSSLLF